MILTVASNGITPLRLSFRQVRGVHLEDDAYIERWQVLASAPISWTLTRRLCTVSLLNLLIFPVQIRMFFIKTVMGIRGNDLCGRHVLQLSACPRIENANVICINRVDPLPLCRSSPSSSFSAMVSDSFLNPVGLFEAFVPIQGLFHDSRLV